MRARNVESAAVRGGSQVPKHAQVYAALRREIQAGRWVRGERLPSEAELVRRFGASRITVGRAMRDLQERGLIERRAGSGSYVKSAAAPGGHTFGLLIPDLGETEIFEAVCQGMMASPLAREHALIWGSVRDADSSKEERAWQLCHQYIERQVSGVFFAPLELSPDKDDVNQRIAQALDDARVPVVLLDRTVWPYPRRGHHDLVGIDNRRAGYVVTDHLLRQGARRIAFIAAPHTAATIEAREAGYREALFAWDAPIDRAWSRRIDPEDRAAIREFMNTARPDAIVCGNDRTAARVMHALLALEYRIPGDVRLVGIDDLEYASLLPVPLTTLRQPTRPIGDAALSAMLDRVARRELPARDILLPCELVVRRSCGA
ncbi:MAG TPA: GntR family transcriptional regulator [Polyangiaceae bacterium]|nr:GntR family transcriptional regulator [Polyangiaceae bacterium]